MQKPKIDKIELSRLLRSGKSQREAARHFGVSEAAVSKAKKELNINVVRSVALENAHRVVDKNLNTIDQLHKINLEANRLLDELEQTPEVKIKIMAEIRNQLKLQLEIFQALYDMKAVQEFQQEVLAAIGEANLEIRDAIIDKLNKKSALRRAINFD